MIGASATHALRALAYLAANAGGEATLGRRLARDVGVPAPYLAKVLGTLARAGVVVATRGARGGYRLARSADRIALVEIVEPFEGHRVRPGCLLRPEQPCREDGACSAHEAWSEVKGAFERFLRETTLADIRGGAVPLPGRPPHPKRRRSGGARRSTHPKPRRSPSR